MRIILLCLILIPAYAGDRKTEIRSTESIPFVSGGSIVIDKSFGELRIEGWDKPEVELTVIKAAEEHKADRVQVTTRRQADNRLLIASRIPFRRNLDLKYKIRVPRRSHLSIRHDIGEVKVVDVSGDIEVTNRIGEIELRLPEGEDYEIDARSRIGDVSSDLGGTASRSFLLGAKLFHSPSSEAHRLYLRVGIGEISVHRIDAADRI